MKRMRKIQMLFFFHSLWSFCLRFCSFIDVSSFFFVLFFFLNTYSDSLSPWTNWTSNVYLLSFYIWCIGYYYCYHYNMKINNIDSLPGWPLLRTCIWFNFHSLSQEWTLNTLSLSHSLEMICALCHLLNLTLFLEICSNIMNMMMLSEFLVFSLSLLFFIFPVNRL